MKKFALVILAVLASVCAFAQNPSTVDWARNDKYNTVRDTLSFRPKAVFYGDSITECWAIDMPFFESHKYLELGVGGMTSCQLLVRFRTDVINLHPKYVVIMCGTNDIAQNIGPVDPEVVMGNIISMCELAKANRIKPILCSITPCDLYRWAPQLGNPSEKIIAMNKAIASYAKEAKIPYVDYYSALEDGNGALKPEYTVDHCHLTLDAYKVMESIIVPYLR